MTAILDVALDYISRGWSPVPIPFKSKAPVLPGWQNLRITAEEAPRYFNGGRMNGGVILGPASGNLVDADLDCSEAIRTAPYFLPKTCMFGRHSAPASHWLFCASGFSFDTAVLAFSDPTRSGDDARLVELRVGGERGCQTVFPGSVHPSGEGIRWERDTAPEPVRIGGADLEEQVRRLAAATLVARHWPKTGERHIAAQALGGALRRSGWDTPQIKLFVQAVVDASGDEELNDRRRAVVDAATAVDAGQRAYGIPKLAEVLGDKKVVDAVVQWLRLQSDVWSTHTNPQGHDDAGPPPNWPEPQPLPEGLLPVAPFTTDFLPFTLSSWVDDIAERMQCPPEFIAVTAVAALGAVLGRRIGVRPQQRTDWVEVCSFWGCVVGRPGWLKSPAMPRH